MENKHTKNQSWKFNLKSIEQFKQLCEDLNCSIDISEDVSILSEPVKFGLASIKFRWNVSGTYMQVIPRIFSTDKDGNDEKEFLTNFFPTMSKMAANIFLKGYQWPFDPQRIENLQSSIIDIYKEHGIDLYSEPLEIAVCAQHNNGGFAVNKWWESNIKQTFVIGEMAGTHGVKRPGGSALNAGQVGAQRAAEFIVNTYSPDIPKLNTKNELIQKQIEKVISNLKNLNNPKSNLTSAQTIAQIQHRMTVDGGHIRKLENAQNAVKEAIELYKNIISNGLDFKDARDTITAIQTRHLALSSIAYLRAIIELLKAGSGSRGSHLVLTDDGIEMHPDIKEPDTGRTLKFKPENEKLRNSILRIQFDEDAEQLFSCKTVSVRSALIDRKAFESAWADYRENRIYQ